MDELEFIYNYVLLKFSKVLFYIEFQINVCFDIEAEVFIGES